MNFEYLGAMSRDQFGSFLNGLKGVSETTNTTMTATEALKSVAAKILKAAEEEAKTTPPASTPTPVLVPLQPQPLSEEDEKKNQVDLQKRRDESLKEMNEFFKHPLNGAGCKLTMAAFLLNTVGQVDLTKNTFAANTIQEVTLYLTSLCTFLDGLHGVQKQEEEDD